MKKKHKKASRVKLPAGTAKTLGVGYPATGSLVEIVNCPHSALAPGMVGLVVGLDSQGLHVQFDNTAHTFVGGACYRKELSGPKTIIVWLKHNRDYKPYGPPTGPTTPPETNLPVGSPS